MHKSANAFGECPICECHLFYVLWENKRFRATGIGLLEIQRQEMWSLPSQNLWSRLQDRTYLTCKKVCRYTDQYVCVPGVQCSLCQMFRAAFSRAKTVCGDWFIREERLELYHVGSLLLSGSQFYSPLLSVVQGDNSLLALTIRFPHDSSGPLHSHCHKEMTVELYQFKWVISFLLGS